MGHELVELHGRFLDGHGLQHDLSGAADVGVKQAFTAQENIFCSPDHFNINGAGAVHHGEVSRIHNHPLSRFQLVFHRGTVDFQKHRAVSGKFLHDEAFAAEEALSQSFLEKDFHVHAGVAGEEAPFLRDYRSSGGKLHRDDGSGEAGRERDFAVPLRRIPVAEQGFTGKHPSEHLADAAAFRFHPDSVRHP